MKRNICFILLFVVLVFALVIMSCAQAVTPPQNLGAASLSLQDTPIPPDEDQSVIGSTDGILIMGIVIVMIISLPILLHRKKK